jgi:hypothetical protein
MSNRKALILAVWMLAAVSAHAQGAAATTPRADQREVKQQVRIDQGVASGQLNARETGRLEKQQARVTGTEVEAKADGVVTTKERRELRRKQDRASHNIERQKHDAQAAPKS